MLIKATTKYNLRVCNPSLSKEWHPLKNGSLSPLDVTAGSGRKAWWLCSKGHEWEAPIYRRNQGHGCPYCSGNKVNGENCLQALNPSLAKEWHPVKNGNRTPMDVTLHSGLKFWWRCAMGHEWVTTVADRSHGYGCPYCSGNKVNNKNCLQTVNPTLARQWHPTKNESLTPKDVTAGSHKKAWWKCSRGHEWNAVVKSRNKGNGCPYCHSQTSQLELRVFTEMKFLFHDVEHRKKIHGVECDVYLPSLNLAIEVDGVYFHKDKYEQDIKKTNILKNANVDLIRIREKGLPKVSSHDILCKTTKNDFSIFHNLIQQIILLKPIGYDVRNRIKAYLTKAEFANNQEYIRIWNMLPAPFPELSVEALNPSMAKEWHPSNNGSLTPMDVTINSHKLVWWKCSKGHEWKATVNDRSNKGTGCPYCSGNKVNNENCLQTVNPTLAKEWHHAKNGSLTPKDLTAGSTKKVWWKCSKGHEWEATVGSRNTGNGCPYCDGKKVSHENCLQTVNPTLAKEWHPTKNGSRTPVDVTSSANKKVWWLCSKGHEWEATVNNRSNKGSHCPYCDGRKASDENSLQALNPSLAKEWHPTKNGNLTPRDVTVGSNTKVWWLCSKGHEWPTIVNDRSRGSGCPACYRQRRQRLRKTYN